jgi:zona occludens toxin (predicted ATPase)
MKKTVLFALPLVALMLAVACKKQEAAAPAAPEQVAGTATEAAAPAATPAATPAAAPAATPAPAAAPAAAPAKPVAKKGK